MTRAPWTPLLAAADLALGAALLTGFAWVGQRIADLTPALPITGPLWGMGLAFVALATGVLPEARVRRAASALIAWLGLLFVPVGVGVVAYGDLVARHAPAITAAIVVGTVATLLAAGAAAAFAGRGRTG